MDRVVIDEKIEPLRRCVVRVQASVPDSIEAFREDLDAQDVVVLNLTRAIQICVDIGTHILSATDSTAPSTMGEVFSALSDTGFISQELAASLRRAVGFRNVAVHAYDDLNLEIVYAIATQHMNDFSGFATAVAKA